MDEKAIATNHDPTDEQKQRILAEIIELVKPPEPPSDAINTEDYAKAAGVSKKRARAILRQGVVDGKLEMIKHGNVGYWRAKSDKIDKT